MDGWNGMQKDPIPNDLKSSCSSSYIGKTYDHFKN